MMQFSQMQKCSLYLEIRTVFCIDSCDHNYIHSTLKFLFMQTITLPDQSRQMVTHNAVSHLFTY